MWFEGKWMELVDITLSKPGSERQRPSFLSYVEDRSKGQTYTQNQI
jgi:hypothetical protein